MKILFGIESLVATGGITRVVNEMAGYLDTVGYTVRIVTSRCTVETKVPVILCRYNKRIYQADIWDVIKIIRRENPDIFHSHFYPMNFCGAVTNLGRTKHVMHSHGINYAAWRLGVRNLLSAMRADVGECLGAHFSARVVAISNYIKNVLTRRYRVRGDKIQVIHNTVDLVKFNPLVSGQRVRESYGIASDDVLLLFVAAITPRKRHDLIIECMKLVTDNKPNVRLLIVGAGGESTKKYEASLNNMVHELSLERNIIFCGSVRDELPEYYAASDIYVSPSSWESFGLPFIEAMACSKPVIGFDVSAISEIIVNEHNGYKVAYPDIREMADRILYLAENTEAAKRLGANGRSFAEEKFSAEREIRKAAEMYSQLCGLT